MPSMQRFELSPNDMTRLLTREPLLIVQLSILKLGLPNTMRALRKKTWWYINILSNAYNRITPTNIHIPYRMIDFTVVLQASLQTYKYYHSPIPSQTHLNSRD
jgi:hypothetical protein